MVLKDGTGNEAVFTTEAGYLFQYFTSRTENAQLLCQNGQAVFCWCAFSNRVGMGKETIKWAQINFTFEHIKGQDEARLKTAVFQKEEAQLSKSFIRHVTEATHQPCSRTYNPVRRSMPTITFGEFASNAYSRYDCTMTAFNHLEIKRQLFKNDHHRDPQCNGTKENEIFRNVCVLRTIKEINLARSAFSRLQSCLWSRREIPLHTEGKGLSGSSAIHFALPLRDMACASSRRKDVGGL